MAGTNGSTWNTKGNLPSHPFACQINQSYKGKDEEEHSGEAIPLVIFLIKMEQHSDPARTGAGIEDGFGSN